MSDSGIFSIIRTDGEREDIVKAKSKCSGQSTAADEKASNMSAKEVFLSLDKVRKGALYSLLTR